MNKKIFSFFCIPFLMPLLTCCSIYQKGNIQAIYLKGYNAICPVDVYKVLDGYMYTDSALENKKTHTLEKEYSYCTYKYAKDKKTISTDGDSLLNIDYSALKIFKRDYQFGIYYSNFWGEEETVSFTANIKFEKTYHIVLQEKLDTYKITYYDIGNFQAFDNLSSINDYKKTIEVLKSNISRIEYF